MSRHEKPWVILVTRSDELGAPIVGVSRRKTTKFSHRPGELRRFASRGEAESYLDVAVEKDSRRCYTVTTL